MRFIVGLVVAVGILAVELVSPAHAASVTLNFSGTVASIDDPRGLTTYGIGDTISGSLVIGPLNDAPTATYPAGTQYTAPASFSFAPVAENGAATIETHGSPLLGYFGIIFQAANSTLLLDFTADGTAAVPLQSLADLPADLTAILSYLGGSLLASNALITGGPDLAHQFFLEFNPTSVSLSVGSVAVTPIPAALPMFFTALGGLGFMARRCATRRIPASPLRT